MSGGVAQVEPVIDLIVRTLCTTPYPGRKKGCPNYNKRGKLSAAVPAAPSSAGLDKAGILHLERLSFRRARRTDADEAS